jgi:hypothetical protein
MALFLPGVSSSEDNTCTTLPVDLCYLVGGHQPAAVFKKF